jgi:hypothetical protein
MSTVGSDPWLARFAAAVADVDPGDVRITVRHSIVDGPSWVVRAADDGVSVGRDGEADVTFTWLAADAAAVAQGAIGALVPFQAGRLRVGGDLNRLRAAADLFARLPRA